MADRKELHVKVAPDGSVTVWCECPHECPGEQDFLVDALKAPLQSSQPEHVEATRAVRP